jgi:hypothetical protein
MKSTAFLSILMIALASLCSAQYAADPGLPDTVKITGSPLVVGQSRPLMMTIVNDELVGAYSFGYLCRTLDSGFAKFDSIVYINRFADPSVFPMRILNSSGVNGTTPDTILLGGDRGMGNAIPLGNSATALLYFTGVLPGVMEIDSVFVPPAAPFIMTNIGGSYVFFPQYAAAQFEILPGHPGPLVSVPSDPLRIVAGTSASFGVQATSPDNFPLTVSFVGMTLTDDPLTTPNQAPTVQAGNPLNIQWGSTSGDIGIWTATFQACDSTGECTSATVEIQVVGDPSDLVSYSILETTHVPVSFGLCHGIFDTTAYPELLFAGNEFHIYDFASGQGWNSVLSMFTNFPTIAPHTGYFDSDANLDAVMSRFTNGPYNVNTFFGDGHNGFSVVGVNNDGHVTRSSAVGEFTGDNHLDYACTWYEGVYIYGGDGAGGFHFSQLIPTTDSALSVSSADFNDDGYADLAVGTTAGIRIYLSNGHGVFALAHSYPQTYGVIAIEVTNQGSDFNNDNIYDLCISTPSVGGAQSQLVVYLGNGDGSFTQQLVRTVNGQIFGNVVGDFNADGDLDIAYVNGARKYVAIIWGAGNGTFPSEIRYPLPRYSPRYIDCFDIDLDGDLDIVAYAAGPDNDNSLYTLINQFNPGNYARQSLTFLAHDNAAMELVSGSGKVLNQIRSSIPTGEYFNKNLDQDNLIDDIAQIGVTEAGAYKLRAKPKPNVATDQTFTLEYSADGKMYRLAHNTLMQPAGYEFGLYPAGTGGVSPKSGEFIHVNQPAFMWPGTGQFDFQLATDPAFNDILINTAVTGNIYSVAESLPNTDTTTYYWRVKPHSGAQFDAIYAINIVPGASSACGDVNLDSRVNVGDIVFMINGIFKQGPLPQPFILGDTNCDSKVNVGDIAYLINFVFKGGSAPCCH